jgi:hypothetical protein
MSDAQTKGQASACGLGVALANITLATAGFTSGKSDRKDSNTGLKKMP